MSDKPIFVATHPRACSTAFERVFMTRRETIQCVHEPFGDAFYYGPERLSARFAGDEKARIDSGFSQSTFKTIIDRLDRESSEGKRVFIKDILHYLFPPNGKPASIAPSLQRVKRGVGTPPNGRNASSSTGNNDDDAVEAHQNGIHTKGEPYPYPTDPEPGNPTVIPYEILSRFHFAFLIRDPHLSIPSYYRCTIPPLDKVTGFHNYDPSEAGYDELRRGFDYLRTAHLVGPRIATRDDDTVTHRYDSGIEICVIDADDMLHKPAETIEAFCRSVGFEYTPDMLKWDTEEDYRYAKETFEKWRGFHNDAIESKGLVAREGKRHTKTEEEYDAEWRQKYGDKGAAIIRKAVDQNMVDYLYLKKFALQV
ncbi:hypothetical protein MPDQ_002917 [Monascus purpureus]|uniref:P-loop containing nucleoside triphosphate hydrolase protein n=1 Tax=Monascus purpureus TaxID=5098 RepID=A0A507QNJ7_MONPU|nr:hypothetical protein MPDQ_002917 [Monascus purpureus]BDD57251.1 hypothetical protein MAP00_002634 [Monascus purpureus]